MRKITIGFQSSGGDNIDSIGVMEEYQPATPHRLQHLIARFIQNGKKECAD